ncbi:MAG: oligopeptide ABC transporter permease [Lachnospirales bacterium]
MSEEKLINNNLEQTLEKQEEVANPWKVFWGRYKKNKVAVIALIVFLILALLAIFAPFLTPYDRDYIDLVQKFKPPSSEHWLGTDIVGRDYFTRMLYGGRISLTVGLVAALVSVAIGVAVGGAAGYFGGKVDNLLMRIAEIVASFPFMPMMITLSFMLQGTGISSTAKLYFTMVLIGALGWPGLARLVRSQILTLREQEFMEATEAIGVSNFKKIFKHLIPNVLSVIIVSGTLKMASAILTESTLSFLGLGVIPPTPTWGNMIKDGNEIYTLNNRPWIWIPPGVAIFLAVVSINLIGEGLRDAFDPKSDRR